MEPLQSAAAKLVKAEALGDLKLYRVADRTSVTSRQIKQVRLLDRHAIPLERLYTASIWPGEDFATEPLHQVLRTRNDRAHHLGLPLPSGELNSFAASREAPLLVGETPFGDTSLDQDIEIDIGADPDVEVTATIEDWKVNLEKQKVIPLIPGVSLRSTEVSAVNRVEINNARYVPTLVELRVILMNGARLIRTDHPAGSRNGDPTFTLTVPAQGTATVRYQTGRTSYLPVSP
jgi:hypothetical protein